MHRSTSDASTLATMAVGLGLTLLGLVILQGAAATRPRRLPAPARRDPARHGAAMAPGAAKRPGADDPVRPAGTESMRDPPSRWDEADETSDESFPASDPPARY